MNANVSLHWAYNMDNPKLLGNWRFKRIAIENGTYVRVFIVPPAQWTTVSPDEKNSLIDEVLHSNPYSLLKTYLIGKINCRGCSMEVQLNASESQMLIRSITFGRQAPLLELTGTLSVTDGNVLVLSLKGASKDGTVYTVNVEVKRL